MEKINKEELMKKLNLAEKEREKVAGGEISEIYSNCYIACLAAKNNPEECRKDCAG